MVEVVEVVALPGRCPEGVAQGLKDISRAGLRVVLYSGTWCLCGRANATTDLLLDERRGPKRLEVRLTPPLAQRAEGTDTCRVGQVTGCISAYFRCS